MGKFVSVTRRLSGNPTAARLPRSMPTPCRSSAGLDIHLQNHEYLERLMLSRRLFLAGSAAAGLGLWNAGAARAEAVMTDDGFYREPWFLESFLELADDLAAARANQKRLAIMWELRGCPYCKETHLVNFAKPEITNYIRERFEILQLNIIGSREVTDFDGEKLTEKKFAQKYSVRGVPVFQFFPDSAVGLAQKAPLEREVARGQGYIEPQPFLDMFRFVADRSYEKGETLRLPQSDKLSQP
jgi:thioredoxin-related protein